MLSFFRRLINSRLGIVITFVALGVIALAFAAGDVTGLRTSGSGGMARTSVATVGGTAIGTADLRGRVQNLLEATQQQQQQAITMSQFIAGGGFDQALEGQINGLALEQFGHRQGMAISKRSVDGQIASLPSLQGANGQFSPALYEQILAARHLTDAQVRGDIARDTVAQQLIAPTQGASQVPQQLALAYASLLLEKRQGSIGFIPTKAMGTGAPPTDAELQAFYRSNVARYSLPERRVLRYALVTPDTVKAQATPSDAEVAASYAADRARYAPTERRTVTQVAVLDQAAANALAARIKGGATVDAAARAAGLEPRTLTALAKPAYANQNSAGLADAVFAAAKGAVVGPVRGPIGYVVAHVDAVVQDPGKTLDQARPEIVKALTATKTQAALGKIQDALNDAVNGNSTFDELASDQKLQQRVTPALAGNGTNPEDAASKPDPALAPVVAAGFAAEQGDAPQLVATGQDGSFALVGLDRVIPAAPRPLAQVRDAVARDFAVDRASRAARKVASTVLGQVEHGTPLATALAATRLTLPPVQPIGAARGQLAANPRGAPAPLVLLFSMAAKTAKVLEAPNKAGWLIVYLDAIQKGNAAGNAALVASTRADFGRAVGREYVEQFGNAVRREVGVKRNAAAIAQLRSELTGGGGSDQP